MVDQPQPEPTVRISGGFDAFYRSEYAGVVALVRAVSGSRWVAEDVTQEAFLRAHRDWSQVGTMASPTGWVRRVAMNLAMSRFRRMRTEARVRIKLGRQPPAIDDMPLPAAEFWTEVRRLPRRQTEAIALHYLGDMSVTDVATALGIAEGTVKALLHQGRRRLAERLDPVWRDPDGDQADK